jgi:putative ABC transport system permease protein
VMEPGFRFPATAELWVPQALDAAEARGERYLWAVARLKAGVTPERATAEIGAVARRLEREHAETNAGWGAYARTLRDDSVDGQLRTMLFLMLGAVGFVLLIACANVANLLLARASARRREIAVRAALGAGRGRLVRQLLTESVLVALAGGTLGVGIAVWWVHWVVERIPEELPYWMRFDVDGRVLLYTLALALGTGIVFGVAPALRASRADLQGTLKEGGRGASGAPRGRLRAVLVGGEMALAMVLLVGAALMIRSFLAASAADPGFDTARMLTLRTWLAGPRYADDARARRSSARRRGGWRRCRRWRARWPPPPSPPRTAGWEQRCGRRAPRRGARGRSWEG